MDARRYDSVGLIQIPGDAVDEVKLAPFAGQAGLFVPHLFLVRRRAPAFIGNVHVVHTVDLGFAALGHGVKIILHVDTGALPVDAAQPNVFRRLV
ncbi:hypothetical protein SDC9_106085 [bioreactor metagenome]|uniref:Uncharacterized protein n=1 Tax=bioreactor metagenome TaxID=1076179 RepID=A0A645B1A6_9ZZZZ